MKKYLYDYCVGCGLCSNLEKGKCVADEKGFIHPEEGDISWLESVCPSGGNQQSQLDFSNIWGRYISVYYGWSNNPNTRKKASSGGVITEIASWMLENGKADSVLHIGANPDDPTKTANYESTNRVDVTSHCGSRYAISHPLSSIPYINRKKRYVVIGKPCDIVALKNYMQKDRSLLDCIVLTLSFFCAGLPSEDAQDMLLNHMGCSKSDLVSLKYRGDGWPGRTVAIDSNGNRYSTDYNTAWGRILGRDIMKACRFCLDGIGELSDISCGDAWYLTEFNQPDFTESEGRNVIFSRTEAGEKILNSVIDSGNIGIASSKIDDLKHIQTYQWERRATMIDKIIALRLLGKSSPRYSLKNLLNYSREIPIHLHLRIFIGTLKRIIMGKI